MRTHRASACAPSHASPPTPPTPRAPTHARLRHIQEVRDELVTVNEEIETAEVKVGKLQDMMHQLVQHVVSKEDGSPMSAEAKTSLGTTLRHPINAFFEGNEDVRDYIERRLATMETYMGAWPTDARAGRDVDEAALAAQLAHFDDFALIQQLETDSQHRRLAAAAARTSRGGVPVVVEGTYVRCTPSDPPIAPALDARTCAVETTTGELLMLGLYHSESAKRSLSEIERFAGQRVRVSGVRYDNSTPLPVAGSAMVAATTPYIEVDSLDLLHIGNVPLPPPLV